MNRIKHLFNDALELDPNERGRFLNAACGGDAELRREVESLLNSYNRDEAFLQTPAVDFSAVALAAQMLESEEASAIGKQVGAYRIVREIGRGGMGVVYLAVRDDGQFQKRVAIKLLRRGLENATLVRRFHHERQILADLEHPNIARLLDGGATENGLPYFVMEYVEGLPINRYCDEQNVAIDERLKLFRQICAAVEFAHEQAIIHRDLKPGNILVTKEGIPKLLDFGIAKTSAPTGALDSRGTTLHLMTPEYASPEQMRGERVSKSTDIYSLGVILYELIAGRRPYIVDGKSPYEIVQAICENEPPAPSRVWAESSANVRLTRPQPTNRPKQSPIPPSGDLDNIVLKALRKEPERRYLSVKDLAEDIQRLLAGLPVSARQDTFFYRGARFVKRHQTAVLSALAVAFVFVLAGFALSFYGRRAQSETANNAKPVQPSSPDAAYEKRKGGTDNSDARELYLKGQNLWNQRTLITLKQAADYFQQAIEKDPEFALAYCGLSNSYFLLSVWGSSRAREAFPKAKAAAGKAIELAPEAAEGHLALAMVLWLYDWDWPATDRTFKKALELNPNYARAPHWYGLFLAEMGRFAEAIAAEKRALAIEPQSIPVNADLGRVLFYARRYPEAVEQYRKTIAMNPNFDAFYSELRELYEAAEMEDEWAKLMERVDGFDNLIARQAYLRDGMKGYWRKVIQLQHSSKSVISGSYYFQAERYAQLGEKDPAFALLDKAFEERDHRMAQIKVHPKLDKLRPDPRFAELLRRMNFAY